MKVEKISETQLKFVLNQSELQDRDIHLTELAYGSEKTQQLFREMMEQAMVQCNFSADNTPLMIEAVPLSIDSIMIIVTKVAEAADNEKHLDILENLRKARNRLQKMRHIEISQDRPESHPSNPLCVYSFATLDDAASASSRLMGYFTGRNALYKHYDRYFLVLHNDNPMDRVSTDDLGAILGEYGQKHISAPLSEVYLNEYAQLLIQDGAVHILATYLG
jgi:adapter protein MecA 1/2